jgi:HSP20 family protein
MAWNLVPRRRAEIAHGRGDDPFALLEQHVQRFFEEPWTAFGPAAADITKVTQVARLDVSDNGDELVIEAELPGVAEDDIDVSITNDVLRVRAEKRSDHKQERKGWYVEERTFGAFERAVRLPVEIEADKVEAVYERGVLRLRLPKSSRGRDETKRISVRGANGSSGDAKESKRSEGKQKDAQG